MLAILQVEQLDRKPLEDLDVDKWVCQDVEATIHGCNEGLLVLGAEVECEDRCAHCIVVQLTQIMQPAYYQGVPFARNDKLAVTRAEHAVQRVEPPEPREDKRSPLSKMELPGPSQMREC